MVDVRNSIQRGCNVLFEFIPQATQLIDFYFDGPQISDHVAVVSPQFPE
jgi:hypothetical protein